MTANRVLSAYSDSLIVGFTPNHTNTGAATLNVSGLGAKTIVRPNGDTVLAGDIVNGSKVLVIYVQSPVDKFLLLSMPATSASISLAVGAVMAWPTENIPAGCLLADGSAVSRTTYAALFAAYGTRYGNGDGATTFNLPNYKDYVLRGHDAGGTDAGSRTDRGDGTTGANVGTKQAAATKSHTHAVGTLAVGTVDLDISYRVDNRGSPGSDNVVMDVQLGTGLANDITLDHTHTLSGSSATTGESANETRGKNITVNWIIVATPAAALATSGIGRNAHAVDVAMMTARDQRRGLGHLQLGGQRSDAARLRFRSDDAGARAFQVATAQALGQRQRYLRGAVDGGRRHAGPDRGLDLGGRRHLQCRCAQYYLRCRAERHRCAAGDGPEPPISRSLQQSRLAARRQPAISSCSSSRATWATTTWRRTPA